MRSNNVLYWALKSAKMDECHSHLLESVMLEKLDKLATKDELSAVKAELKSDISDVKADISDVKASLAAMQAQLSVLGYQVITKLGSLMLAITLALGALIHFK